MLVRSSTVSSKSIEPSGHDATSSQYATSGIDGSSTASPIDAGPLFCSSSSCGKKKHPLVNTATATQAIRRIGRSYAIAVRADRPK